MGNEIESFEHAGKVVKIFRDDDPMNNPREWDNLATFACWHRRLNFGDKQINGGTEEELREELEERGEEVLAVLPLYLYQHSGMTIRTTPFGCRWDSGQVGWAYVTKASAVKMGCVGDRYTYENGTPVKVGTWDEAAYEEAIRQEVETYDQYLRGDIYGYEVKNREGDHLDSCWGFFGLDDVREQAKHAAEQAEDPADDRMAEELASRATYAAG